MPALNLESAEAIIRKEAEKLDKRVQIVAIVQTKKKDTYRVTLVRNGRHGTVDLKKKLIEQALSEPGEGAALRKAIGKAVSHLSIRPGW